MQPTITGAKQRRPIYSGWRGRIASAVDAAVETFAPGLAHKMRVNRINNAAVVAYEGARFTRTNPMPQGSGSADSEAIPDLPNLRQMSRTLVRDDSHAAATINILVEFIIGEGVRPLSVCTPAATGMTDEQCRDWNAQVDRAWKEWAEGDRADATGYGSYYQLQENALRTQLTDGDAIGHSLFERDGSIEIELIDADRIESPNYHDTKEIRGGVERNPRGREVAVHVLKDHPADSFAGAHSSESKRIEVRSGPLQVVQHVFHRGRPGQTRGVPILAPVLLSLRHLHHYLDSEVIGARAASNFALFIKRNVQRGDASLMPVAELDQNNQKVQHYHEALEAGTIEYLNEGEEPVSFNPNRPGNAFEAFVMRLLRSSAAATGLSYEAVARDYGRMNLSSARTLINQMRRGFAMTLGRFNFQWNRPHRENFIRHQVATGRLVPPDRRAFLSNPQAFLATRWVSPAFPLMDPMKDYVAAAFAIENNLASPMEKAAEFGVDPVQVLEDKAKLAKAAQEIEEREGLKPGTLTAKSSAPRTPPGDGPPKPGQDPEDGDEPDIDDTDDEDDENEDADE